MIEIKGKTVFMVHVDDISSAFPSKSGYNTPVALAITRETGRACYVTRMGYVCDLWMCFAVISPAVYRLLTDWEKGRLIKPFMFDIHFVKEFDAYPGGIITEVKQLPGKASVRTTKIRKPFCMPKLKRHEIDKSRCMAMQEMAN